MSKSIVTFGELMLRLSPPDYLRLVQTDTLEVHYGGSEANVAVSLANYGVDTHYITKLPSNPLGQAALNHIRRFGVNVENILRGGERLGIYFAEKGASQRSSLVVYDRAESAFAELQPGEIPWDEIFQGKAWFHFSGITPALGERLALTTFEAVKMAKKMGLVVSCDLNYRKKLWSPEQAKSVMEPIFEYVDVISGLGKDEAVNIFNLQASQVTDLELAQLLCEKYGFKYVANTIRTSHSVHEHTLSGMLFDGQNLYQAPLYDVDIVDRIGGGDAFIGALIFALVKGYAPQNAVNFAVAAFCLKHTIPGDINHATLEEVTNLAQGNGSLRVQR